MPPPLSPIPAILLRQPTIAWGALPARAVGRNPHAAMDLDKGDEAGSANLVIALTFGLHNERTVEHALSSDGEVCKLGPQIILLSIRVHP
jgi:hypothetical protein